MSGARYEADDEKGSKLEEKSQNPIAELETVIKQRFELEKSLYFNQDGKLVCEIKNQKPLVGLSQIFQFLRLAKLEFSNPLIERCRLLEKWVKAAKETDVLKNLLSEANQEKIDIRKIIELVGKLKIIDLVEKLKRKDDYIEASTPDAFIEVLSVWIDVFAHPQLSKLMNQIHKYALIMEKFQSSVDFPKGGLEAKSISDLEAVYEKAIQEKITELDELQRLYCALTDFYISNSKYEYRWSNVSPEDAQDLLDKIKKFGIDQLKSRLTNNIGPKSIFDLVFNANTYHHRSFSPVKSWDPQYSDLLLHEEIQNTIKESPPGFLPVNVKDNELLKKTMKKLEDDTKSCYLSMASSLLVLLEEFFDKYPQEKLQPWFESMSRVMLICSGKRLYRDHNALHRIVALENVVLLRDFLNIIADEIDLNRQYPFIALPLLIVTQTVNARGKEISDATRQEMIKLVINAGASPEGLEIPEKWRAFVNKAREDYLKEYQEVMNDKLKIRHLSSIVHRFSGFQSSGTSEEPPKDQKSEPPKP